MIRHHSHVQLDDIPAFQHLNSQILKAMTEASRTYYLAVGDVLLYQGNLIQSFYAVYSGGMRLVDYT
ncbi:MAG: hypothetical protein K8I30_15195, partial [Anaerolineae bacterium]|nr:hypothetical protein [Anaerolineae bacterium]